MEAVSPNIIQYESSPQILITEQWKYQVGKTELKVYVL
jgi:hypothetical protein